MNKREFVRHIKEILELDNFKAVGFGAGSVSLIRGEEVIIIPYNKYPDQFILPPAITGRKCFAEVEDILEKHFTRHNINYVRNTIHNNSRRVEDLKIRTIEEVNDFSKILPELKNMVYEDILPFFEKHQTLEQVHNTINQLKISELSKFIFSPIHPRIMVIKRLINIGDWENYCEESIEIHKEQSQGKYKAVFEPIYRFLPELFEELKQIDHPL